MPARVIVRRNHRAVELELTRHGEAWRDGVQDALHAGGARTVRRAQKLIEDPPKTGRIYRLPLGKHRASKPGQPPADREGKIKTGGTLRKSVGYEVRGVRELEVGDSVFYGEYLEKGTRKMAPRPHLLPAVNLTAGDLVVDLQQYVANRINRGRRR